MTQRKKLDIGETIVSTKGVLRNISTEDIIDGLSRHFYCDWGNVDDEDWVTNNRNVESGNQILSSYHTQDDINFWIITEADRSVTTVLLPEEY